MPRKPLSESNSIDAMVRAELNVIMPGYSEPAVVAALSGKASAAAEAAVKRVLTPKTVAKVVSAHIMKAAASISNASSAGKRGPRPGAAVSLASEG